MTNLGIFWGGIGFILRILTPVIMGALIAFLLNPIVQFFEKKVFRKLKIRSGRYLHGACVILVVLVLVLLLLVLIYLVVSQVAVSATHLLSHLDDYVQAFVRMINKYLADKISEINILGVNLLETEKIGRAHV